MLETLLGVGLGIVLTAFGAVVAVVSLVSIGDWSSIYSRGGFGEPPLTKAQWLSRCLGGVLCGVLIGLAGVWMLNSI